MSVDVTEIKKYEGQRVVLTRNLSEPNESGESAVEVEGEVQAANEMGVLIKPKGQVQFKLIPLSEIEEVSLRETKANKLKASKLALCKLGKARSHLLERHGVTLEWANEVSEEDAYKYHESIDHVKDDLGHVHVDKDAEKAKADADSSGSES